MFLILGMRTYETLLVLVTFVCPHCRVEAGQRVTKSANRFTAFFIPLFSVSTRYFVECAHCGTLTALTKQQAEHSLDWAAAQARA